MTTPFPQATSLTAASTHPGDDYNLANTYTATIDVDIEAARKALRAISPGSSLAARLSALGLDDRAEWTEAAGSSSTDEPDEFGFALRWRFGPPGQTARIDWRIRLSEDGAGRTMLSNTTRAQASNSEAAERILAGWPILERIALQHAKGLRRAIDEYVADPYEADHALEPPLLSAAA